MADLSPRITTVDRRAERRRRLQKTRRRVLLLRLFRSGGKTLSFALSAILLAHLFPWLMNAAQERAADAPPRSFTATVRQGGDGSPLTEPEDSLNTSDTAFLAEPPDTAETTLQTEAPDTAETPPKTEALDTAETTLQTEAPDTPGAASQTEAPEIWDTEEIVDFSLDSAAESTDGGMAFSETDKETTEDENTPAPEAQDSPSLFQPYTTPSTFPLTADIENSAVKSRFAVVMDAKTGEIFAERSSDTLMNPASMTKVLTLLVAVEGLTREDGSWDLDSYTYNTKEISEYCWVNDCSMAWFAVGEWVPVRDLLYGMILPSGADAALMLANYVAGSQEAFVERMNAKARELGLSPGAHFENCVGLYGENHVCTARDMAVIMKAAMDHPVCRTVLGKVYWTTTRTEEHPNGISLSNRFLRLIPRREPILTVIGAKTGYVSQAGNCAVSMARREDGRTFLCVTGKGPGSAQVMRDHAALYRLFGAGVSPTPL